MDWIFDTSGFPRRWECGSGWNDDPWVGWASIFGNSLTFLVYVAFSVAIVYLSSHGRLPRKLTISMSIFFFLCGGAHLLYAMEFFVPVYRLDAIWTVAMATDSLYALHQALKFLLLEGQKT